ncbi:hypothetical protein PGLA_06865 [Paenibacillus glacialis]|uniref:Uncharacterized protein n=1 Tax=Paenibacillus glacialis TaxID=494026 RepID=A0A168M8P4_9BACL|nr:hypothetical protein PGLA_06865 [Paenibacillus glacialis]
MGIRAWNLSLHTQGYTVDHTSLFLKESRVLVTADAMKCVEVELRGSGQQTTKDMTITLHSLKEYKTIKYRIWYYCSMN